MSCPWESSELLFVVLGGSLHFPIDQYLHDRVSPATLSPKPLAYDKPIDPSEMPRISTCTDTITDDTNVPTKDDKYPWLDPDDKRRHKTDAKILRHKMNLEDLTTKVRIMSDSHLGENIN